MVLGVYAIVIGLFVAAVIGIAQFVSLMPQYADQFAVPARRAEVLAGRAWASPRPTSRTLFKQHRQELDRRRSRRALLSSIKGIFSSVLFLIIAADLPGGRRLGVRRADGQAAVPVANRC